MNFLENNCTFYVLDKSMLESCSEFSCGHWDLDDFFNNESYLYSEELLGKSYCFRLNSDLSQMHIMRRDHLNITKKTDFNICFLQSNKKLNIPKGLLTVR